MLLSDLVSGKESSSCVILQDSLEASARPLLLSYIKSLLDRVDLVCLICFDLPPSKFVNAFSSDARLRLLHIDACSDYLKWDSSSDHQNDKHQVFYDSNIPDIVKKAINRRCTTIKSDSPVKVAIAIDSISKLVYHSVSKTCQILHRLSQGDKDNDEYEVEQVVSIVHSDLHEDHVLEALCSISSSVLHILPSTQTTQTDSEPGERSEEIENICKTLHIRKTGKVLKRKQKYMISNLFELTEFDEGDWTSNPKIEPAPVKEPSKTDDPLSDLTFNLKLTKQEEQDRANTHLPYMHHAQGAQVTIHKNQESQIFYQPDEADDFDEDDPDDDLDI